MSLAEATPLLLDRDQFLHAVPLSKRIARHAGPAAFADTGRRAGRSLADVALRRHVLLVAALSELKQCSSLVVLIAAHIKLPRLLIQKVYHLLFRRVLVYIDNMRLGLARCQLHALLAPKFPNAFRQGIV